MTQTMGVPGMTSKTDSHAESPVQYCNLAWAEGYMVGADGSVWSCRRPGRPGGLTGEWRRLSPWMGTTGYFHATLRVGGRFRHYKVHRLVLGAFVGPCPEGLECCHNDGDRRNNSIGNLRWDTRESNIRDRTKHGRLPGGELHPTAKLSDAEVLAIRAEYCPKKRGSSQYDLAEKYGVTQGHISILVNRHQRTAKL